MLMGFNQCPCNVLAISLVMDVTELVMAIRMLNQFYHHQCNNQYKVFERVILTF